MQKHNGYVVDLEEDIGNCSKTYVEIGYKNIMVSYQMLKEGIEHHCRSWTLFLQWNRMLEQPRRVLV